MSTGSKARTDTHTQTDRQTHRHDENITSTAYAGGNKCNTLIIMYTYTTNTMDPQQIHKNERGAAIFSISSDSILKTILYHYIHAHSVTTN